MSRHRPTRPIVIALAFTLLLAPRAGLAADASRPHPHQGVVSPFTGRPSIAPLDESQLASLARGKAVLVIIDEGTGGRGAAIQDIQAPPEIVWDRIMAFEEYPGMVPHVEECEIYHADGGDVRVRFVLGVMMFDYEYFVRHRFHTEDGWATWTLDYTRESDLDDTVGYWSVEPVEGRAGWSRLFYSVDIRTRGWMPGFVRNMIARQGLEAATAWVKREAESKAAEPATMPAGS